MQSLISECTISVQLPLIKGGSAELFITSLDKLLPKLAADSAYFAATLCDAVRAAPGGLSLIVYHDAATPGDAFKPDNRRKSTLVCTSFVELGDWLRHCIAWMPTAAHLAVLTLLDLLRRWFQHKLLLN